MKEDFQTLSAYQKAVRTKDVAGSLVEAAFQWQLTLAEIDFDILDVTTFHGDQEIEFNTNELDYMVNRSEPLPLFQMYNIVIYKRASSLAEDIKVKLASNEDITKVYAAIKAKTRISSFQYSKDSFRDLINKKMLVNKLLIGTWSSSLEESIDKIFQLVNKKQEFTLLKDLKFPISQGKDYVPDIPEEMVRHFEDQAIDEKSLKRIDHSNRNFIKSVKKGEMLIEYYYHQKGSYGRNCRGEFFGKEVEDSTVMMMPMVDETTIEIIPHKYGINYYAKQSGYVNIDDPVLMIKNTLDVESVSFRDTGDIAGLEGEKVNVTIGKDAHNLHDTVGMGVTVESETIHIKGNIGSHALLRGKKVIVEGKTHPKSSIYSETVDLNIHSGTAVAKTARVAYLEMGEVRAEKVYVDDLFTGSVVAREVVIHKLHSNSKISASHLIRIDEITGSENYIKLDNVKHKERVEELNAKILFEQQQINRIRSAYDDKLKCKEAQKESIRETLGVIKDYKKRGREAPLALIEKVKSYKNIDTDLRHMVLTMKEHTMTLELLQESTVTLEKELLESRIIIGKMGEGHNTIEFHLHASQKSFRQPARAFTAYTVAKDTQGEYEVRVESYIDGH